MSEPSETSELLHLIEAALRAGRTDEAAIWAEALPHGIEAASLIPAWHAALLVAHRDEDWSTRHALLAAAPSIGVGAATLSRWQRFDAPRFVCAVTLAHGAGVSGMAWASDGARLATASTDGMARVWDVAEVQALGGVQNGGDLSKGGDIEDIDASSETGDAATVKCLRLTIVGHAGPIWGVAWAPDGARLATAGDDKTARIWDATDGRLLQTLVGHTRSVGGVAWAPDGARLATASSDGTARVWDASDGRLLLTITADPGKGVASASWSPDGARLATAGMDAATRMWDASDGHLLLTVATRRALVHTVAWAPDADVGHDPARARLALAGRMSAVQVRQAFDGHPLATLDGHDGYVPDVAWAPDGERLAAASARVPGVSYVSYDGVRVWDVAGARPLAVLVGHHGLVRATAWAPGVHLATGGDDHTARIWVEV